MFVDIAQRRFGSHNICRSTTISQQPVPKPAHPPDFSLQFIRVRMTAVPFIPSVVFHQIFSEGAHHRPVDGYTGDRFLGGHKRSNPTTSAMAEEKDFFHVNEVIGLELAKRRGEISHLLLKSQLRTMRARAIPDAALFTAHHREPSAGQAVDKLPHVIWAGERTFDRRTVDSLDIEHGRNFARGYLLRFGNQASE